MDIRRAVFDALNNAVDNGHNMREFSVEEIVDDLASCDADLENLDPNQFRPFVIEWLKT